RSRSAAGVSASNGRAISDLGSRGLRRLQLQRPVGQDERFADACLVSAAQGRDQARVDRTGWFTEAVAGADLMRDIVVVEQSQPRREPRIPLEVVHQRPVEISPNGYALGDTAHHLHEIGLQVTLPAPAIGPGNGPSGTGLLIGDAVLSHVD